MTTTQPKHTPGPWIVIDSFHRDGDKRIWIYSKAKGESAVDTICHLYEDCEPSDAVVNGGWEERFDNAEANAHLIAAAPEMLEALNEIVQMCHANIPNPSGDQLALLYKAEQAIAKAEGRGI